MAGKATKAPSPAQIYLISPMLGDAAKFAPDFEAALDAAEVACALVRMDGIDPGAVKKTVLTLGRSAQERGVALLIEADARDVARAGADGMHFRATGDAPEEALSEALQALKPDRIVGAGGLRTRHAAMSAGEADVDYVMFGEPTLDGWVAPFEERRDRAAWWSEIFNVPCVVFAQTIGEAQALAETGADFVAVGDAIWDDPRGPALAMRDFAAAVRAAVRPA